ncbi:Flp pilus assembly protein CpaB [Marinobacter sp. HL-58]|uniref:Flp pilus assembly protein CpaB n=1 Tax=Marinobacter sp. HL-58 TaxID=1479237 RepID=UPI000487CAEA|nr:Flp pilus assembly protein CpaB [Marinobacter sp. HL-58]KPP97811.1 MAG: Tad secretion system pilus assembly protein RcpC [Marinobacter sp. HL-58]
MKPRFLYFLPSLLLAMVAIATALFGLMKYNAAEEARKESAAAEGRAAAVTEPEVEQAPVHTYVVAAQNIKPGDALERGSFIEIESSTPIDNAIEAEDVPYDISIETSMEPGELLTTQILEDQSLVRQLVPDGHKAIAFEMSSVASIGGLLRPGDFVDILVSFDERGESESSSKTLLESVEVLSVKGATKVGPSASEEDRRRNSTMVLSVPEERTRELVLASEEAQLSFIAVKRSPLIAEEENESVASIPVEKSAADSAVFLSDLMPESPRRSSNDGNASPEREREDPGRKVQIFEGSEARNVYVQ